MKIKEVSEKCGLTKKTIRFYEAQGLLFPEKTTQNGRDYRTYSDEDVRQLLKVAALRRARLSVEEIRRIQAAPEETPAIFRDYRQRLRQERAELETILAAADGIEAEELTGAEALIARLEPATASMPLPAADIHPHFRYLDDLEELINMRKKKKLLTAQEQKQKDIAAKGATAYAQFSTQNTSSNAMASGSSGFDLSNAQKIAAFNLLMNSKDE